MTRTVHLRLRLVIAVIPCFIHGCKHAHQQPSVDTLIGVPAHFHDHTATWVKQHDWRWETDPILSAFFRQHADWTSSPELEGTPTVYVVPGKDWRRYYWFQLDVDGIRWTYIEYKDNQFIVQQGKGRPFTAGASL